MGSLSGTVREPMRSQIELSKDTVKNHSSKRIQSSIPATGYSRDIVVVLLLHKDFVSPGDSSLDLARTLHVFLSPSRPQEGAPRHVRLSGLIRQASQWASN